MLANNFSGKYPEVGCDEAGRGCLAGPVYAAAVAFPKGYQNADIHDSKKLSEADRETLAEVIRRDALAYSVQYCGSTEIDQCNILQASIRAMHRAIRQLVIKPKYIIVDGNYFLPYRECPHSTIIKGDGKFLSIAAASILAKVERDNYMKSIAQEYPAYQWQQNKGYPTVAHRQAIATAGVTPYHRMSFRLLKDQDNDSIKQGYLKL